jgi:heme-degrading monooxygenase HmoA
MMRAIDPNGAGHFSYIWQYQIEPSKRREFLAAYNSEGAWVQLFSRDRNYFGTVLLQDANDDSRYVTIDYWSSQDARDAFRKAHAADFATLDQRCAAYTVAEEFVGDFTIVDPHPT